MLPNDVSEDAPSVLRWEKGGEIMQLPLRDAREVFEREYLLAQVTRFGGNISRTATFVGMERSALHRKLKSLGLHGGATDERPASEAAGVSSEELSWRVMHTSMGATSSIATPASTSRTAAISSPTVSTRSWACATAS